MNHLLKVCLAILLLLVLAIGTTSPAFAMTGTVEITGFTFTGTPTDAGCNSVDVQLNTVLTGTVDDLGGYDRYGIVMYDDNDTPLFDLVDTIFVGTSVTNEARHIQINSVEPNKITTRTVTVDLYDTPTPPDDPSYAQNTQKLFDFIRQGTLLDSVTDDIGVIPQCASLPLESSTPTPTFAPPVSTNSPSIPSPNIASLVAQCVSHKGTYKSLIAKLNKGDLKAFTNQVNAQAGKKISRSCATELVNAVVARK